MQNAILVLVEWGYILGILFFVFYIGLLRNHSRSVLITSCIVICFNFLTLTLEKPLLQIDDRDLLRFLWYNSFALCEFLVVITIRFSHKVNKMPLSRYARVMQYHFATLGFLQFLGYWDQLALNSALVNYLYVVGVPTIVFGSSIILILAIFKDALIQLATFNELEEKQ